MKECVQTRAMRNVYFKQLSSLIHGTRITEPQSANMGAANVCKSLADGLSLART
jgi:hypothetical protein